MLYSTAWPRLAGSVLDNSKLHNNLLQLAWAKALDFQWDFSALALCIQLLLFHFGCNTMAKSCSLHWVQQEEHMGIVLSDVVRRAKINKNPKIQYLKQQPLTRPLQNFSYDIADFSLILLIFCVRMYNVKWKKVLEQIVVWLCAIIHTDLWSRSRIWFAFC